MTFDTYKNRWDSKDAAIGGERMAREPAKARLLCIDKTRINILSYCTKFTDLQPTQLPTKTTTLTNSTAILIHAQPELCSTPKTSQNDENPVLF